MPFATIRVPTLESLQPAFDYRMSNRVGVLGGTNFAWDASGVYAAFSSRLVSSDDSIGTSPAIVQELDLEHGTHLLVDDAVGGLIWRFVPSSLGSPVGTWELIATLNELVEPDPIDVPYNLRRASTAFLGQAHDQHYMCAWNYGVYRVDFNLDPPTYTRLTSGTVPGFPADTDPVIAIAETNGRLLYMTALTLYWSAPNDPENLVPALGGAGFQVIGERLAGEPFALMPTTSGAIIWSTQGALVCEFIGGDNVFRYWQLQIQTLPVSSFAITQMSNEDYVILTSLGLYKISNLAQPTPITPLFNEFLREYLRSRPNELPHVWYSINDNRLYVSFRAGQTVFLETFVLEIGLDKWGSFNRSHIGFFNYGPSRGQLAYSSELGVVSYLLSPIDSKRGVENHNNPGEILGLSAQITLGWMRAEELVPHADTIQEIQEIVINRKAPFGQVTVVIVDEGLIIDVGAVVFDEGLITDPVVIVVDEGFITENEILTNYGLEVLGDVFVFTVDGIQTTVIRPTLVGRGPFTDLWTTMVPLMYAQLRITASEVDEYFRINSLTMTAQYSGNWS